MRARAVIRPVVCRALVVAGSAALTIGLLAPAGTATETAAGAPSVPVRPSAPAGAEANGTDYEITGRFVVNGTVAKLVDLTSISQVVDGLGRAIGSPERLALRTSGGVSNPVLGQYSCVYRGQHPKGFHSFRPQEIYQDYGFGKVQAQFHGYRLNAARELGGGRYRVESTQFEICGVGGGDMSSKRMRRVGLGITYGDATATKRIGAEWRSGAVPEHYTTELGFEAPLHKIAKVKGGISQTPTNKLLGSFETPFPTSVDAYARNAVNAWWQDDCVGGIPCTRWQGSKSFHGTVAQGLWEFTPQELVAFRGFYFSTFLNTN